MEWIGQQTTLAREGACRKHRGGAPAHGPAADDQHVWPKLITHPGHDRRQAVEQARHRVGSGQPPLAIEEIEAHHVEGPAASSALEASRPRSSMCPPAPCAQTNTARRAGVVAGSQIAVVSSRPPLPRQWARSGTSRTTPRTTIRATGSHRPTRARFVSVRQAVRLHHGRPPDCSTRASLEAQISLIELDLGFLRDPSPFLDLTSNEGAEGLGCAWIGNAASCDDITTQFRVRQRVPDVRAQRLDHCKWRGGRHDDPRAADTLEPRIARLGNGRDGRKLGDRSEIFERVGSLPWREWHDQPHRLRRIAFCAPSWAEQRGECTGTREQHLSSVERNRQVSGPGGLRALELVTASFKVHDRRTGAACRQLHAAPAPEPVRAAAPDGKVSEPRGTSAKHCMSNRSPLGSRTLAPSGSRTLFKTRLPGCSRGCSPSCGCSSTLGYTIWTRTSWAPTPGCRPSTGPGATSLPRAPAHPGLDVESSLARHRRWETSPWLSLPMLATRCRWMPPKRH